MHSTSYSILKNHYLSRQRFCELVESLMISDTITYEEIRKITLDTHGIVHPSWLTKRRNRITRGLYRLPIKIPKEFMSTFIKLLDDLDSIPSAKEYKVLSLIYGIKDGIFRTYEEVGKEMGLSKQRIHQVERMALTKFEVNSTENMNFKMLVKNAPSKS